ILHMVWLPVVIMVGFAGNVLSLMVMMMPRNRNQSSYVYTRVLACTDCGMLLVAAWYYFRTIQVVYISKQDMNTFDQPAVECKLTSWLFQAFSLSGALIIISMTIDRLIAVCLPLKALSVCTVSRAKKIAYSIPPAVFVYTLPF
ncbi:hypothetical protein CAPTEDRAFT_27300, partial [Capitella teleta]